jgi:hypothetical protein
MDSELPRLQYYFLAGPDVSPLLDRTSVHSVPEHGHRQFHQV